MTGTPRASCSWALRETVFEKPRFAPEAGHGQADHSCGDLTAVGWSKAQTPHFFQSRPSSSPLSSAVPEAGVSLRAPQVQHQEAPKAVLTWLYLVSSERMQPKPLFLLMWV